MVVKSAAVTDYSTGKKYTYGDTSGTWRSIRSEGGAINGNAGASANTIAVTASAPAATNSMSPTIPPGGIIGGGSSTSTKAAGSSSQTAGPIPDGWVMTPSGKIVPVGSSTVSMYSLIQGVNILFSPEY